MKRRVIANIALITVACLCALPLSGRAADPNTDPTTALRGSASIPPGTNGDVVELEDLIRDGRIVELRKTTNGSYGASLSYYPDRMTYYAAMFQQAKFWRVFKTQNDSRAETVYADFAKSSSTLADTEIRRIKLEAEKSYADKQIAAQMDRANRLQADLDIARVQQGQVASHQLEQQDAVRELRTEQAAAQAQLRALQIRVQELQKQSDSDLPMPAPVPSR